MYNYTKLPESLREGVKLYIEQGIPVGDFLQAVIENNLIEAVGHADSQNIRILKDIVLFFYWEVPSICWGSKEKYEEWIRMGGYEECIRIGGLKNVLR